MSVITSVIASVIGNVIGRRKIKGIIAIVEKTGGGVQLPLWQSCWLWHGDCKNSITK